MVVLITDVNIYPQYTIYNHYKILSAPCTLRGLWAVVNRVGHAYAEYANDADYAHMRNMRMRMRMRIENLIHIIHI